MRILVIADAEAWHTKRYIVELRKQGHVAFLLSIQTSELVNCQLPLGRYGAAVSYMSHVKKLKAVIDEFRPDVVNAHFASAYGVMAARCRRRFGSCGAIWALTVWGSDILVSPAKSYLHRRRVQYALESADMILADSSYLSDKTAELTETPIEVILWGVERRYVADDAQLAHKAKLVCCVAQSRPLKLFAPRPHRELYANETLLHSIAPMLKSGEATLTVNSTGNLFDALMALAEGLGVRDTVSVYEPCNRDDYIDLLRGQDIYLSAATSDSSPVSLIEAMALGVFSVSAAHAGLGDLVLDDNAYYSQYDEALGIEALDVVKRILELSEGESKGVLFKSRDVVLQKAVYEENIRETVALFERSSSQVKNV